MKGEVLVSSPTQRDRVPIRNWVDLASRPLHALGKVTRRSKSPGFERPITLRTTRAELYKAYKASPEGSLARTSIIQEAHERDRLAQEYLHQSQITVTLVEGEQKSQVAILTPPASKETAENISKPPIVIIPGISCDVDCVDAFAQELALSGRKVMVVGYPDSYMGSVTPEFADAVERSNNFVPHTEFFKQAILALSHGEQFELWGFSTGSTIAANLLSDEDFQKQVTNSVLLSPVGLVDQKKNQIAGGLLLETGRIIRQFNSLGRYVFTHGRGPNEIQESRDERALKQRVFDGLLRNVQNKSSAWETMRVTGGNIVVVSGAKDSVTNSAKGLDSVREVPQVRILKLARGSHNTPLMNPRVVIPEIFQAQLI